MPEIVQKYSDQKDIIALNSVFDSLIVSYLDDVEKYARNRTMANVIRHAVSNSFYEAGSRIKFQGFGNSNYKSREMGEHIVGQELLAVEISPLFKLHFWNREKKQSNAEVDFLIQYEGLLIPVEVKSAATDRLRSLHQFIDRTPHKYTVRIYSGQLEINQIKTLNEKECSLLNLPFYLTGSITEYLKWMISNDKPTQQVK